MSLEDRMKNVENEVDFQARVQVQLLQKSVLILEEIFNLRQETKEHNAESNRRFYNLLDDARADRVKSDERYAELKAEIEARHQELKAESDRKFGEQKAESDRKFEEQKAESDRKFEEQKAESDRKFEELINRLDRRDS